MKCVRFNFMRIVLSFSSAIIYGGAFVSAEEIEDAILAEVTRTARNQFPQDEEDDATCRAADPVKGCDVKMTAASQRLLQGLLSVSENVENSVDESVNAVLQHPKYLKSQIPVSNNMGLTRPLVEKAHKRTQFVESVLVLARFLRALFLKAKPDLVKQPQWNKLLDDLFAQIKEMDRAFKTYKDGFYYWYLIILDDDNIIFVLAAYFCIH